MFRQNEKNTFISFNSLGNNKGLDLIATNSISDLHLTGDSQTLPLFTFDSENHKHENITDWALNQFQSHYKQGAKAETRPLGSMSSLSETDTTQETNTLLNSRVSAPEPDLRITKQDIFYYVYAVLHAPVYRRKYEQNLKREFRASRFTKTFSGGAIGARS